MSDEIRKNAEALIEFVYAGEAAPEHVIQIRNWQVFIDLKASLRPSREEIADYLECELELAGNDKPHGKYINYAIEELRK